MTLRRLAAMAGATLVLCSSPAAAQISKYNTVALVTTFIRGVDVAHDESGGGLVVGGANYIYAQCINGDGYGGGVLTVKPYEPSGQPFGSFPRARFNPSANNYLVVWPEEQSYGMILRARTVRCSDGAMGSTVTIGGAAPFGERGPALAYSTTSARYLVAYETILHVTQVQLLSPDGSALTGPITVSAGQGEVPGAAWNSVRDEFGVSFSDNDGQSSALAVVPASNPAAFRRTAFNSLGSGSKAFMTDVSYNTSTGHYLMGWYQEVAGGRYAKVAEFDNSGALLGFGTAGNFGAYDALAIAYNRISGTSALVGVDDADDLHVAELNAQGVRFAADQTFATGFRLVRYPRVDASAAAPRWFAAFSRGSGSPYYYPFQGMADVVLQTATTGGGPSGSYTSSGGSTTSGGGTTSGGSTSGGCTTVQPGSDWVCVNGSWLPSGSTSTSTPTTSTSSCTTVQPGTGWTCVNGNWLPPGSTSTSTPTTSTSSCTTVQPGTGWTCVNGSWMPPSTSTSTTNDGSCTTVQPGTGWACVNGNWFPPGSTTTSTSTSNNSSCTTVQPGTNWSCVNGSWLPGSTTTSTSTSNDGTCRTVQPGTGWSCVNGNWLPPGSTTTSTSSSNDGTCTTVQPGTGWSCVSGNWFPPGSATNDGTCTTVQPAADWSCTRGNWLPPGYGG